mgnify:CR=1 FL=1
MTIATAPSSCHPSVKGTDLVQLGIRTGRHDFLVALAGNPNTGKSTVFNALTGLRQHTGNWPGKTVARAEGVFQHGGKRLKLVDLPGTYSLLAGSTDEEVARDFLLFGRPDVTRSRKGREASMPRPADATARRTTAEAEAYCSRHPRWPHGHGKPSTTTIVWPSSAAFSKCP